MMTESIEVTHLKHLQVLKDCKLEMTESISVLQDCNLPLENIVVKLENSWEMLVNTEENLGSSEEK